MGAYKMVFNASPAGITSGDLLLNDVVSGNWTAPTVNLGMRMWVIVDNQTASDLYLSIPGGSVDVTALKFPAGALSGYDNLACYAGHDFKFHHTAGGSLSLAALTVLVDESGE